MAGGIRKKFLHAKVIVHRAKKTVRRLFSPPKPDFQFKINKSSITAHLETVTVPAYFGHVFKPDAKVLQLHVESISGRDIITLLNRLKKEVPRFRMIGISGMYGDTPNSAIVKKFIQTFNANVLSPPQDRRQLVQNLYFQKVASEGYSSKYLNQPAVRVIVNF